MLRSLESFPRVSLAHLPTPLEPLPRLSAQLGGPEIWVKRDDATGLGFGGNKARKLEYLLGAAREEGADTVVTVGGVQSNHARQTAAAAARLGMRCQLVLPRVVPRGGIEYEESGNVLLDRLFGAEVFIMKDEAAALRKVFSLKEQAREEGRIAVVHPAGGSTAVGALGFVQAAEELADQAAGQGVEFTDLYAAVGTGGTVAGLACGLARRALRTRVNGICVLGDAVRHRREVDLLFEGLGPLLEMELGPSHAPRLDDAFLGDGYGVPSEATFEAIALVARAEGLLLDPVYTGKAMAGLIADVRAGKLREGPVLFWHTGGAPGLFAYREELEAALGL